jgi:hypothetical protein
MVMILLITMLKECAYFNYTCFYSYKCLHNVHKFINETICVSIRERRFSICIIFKGPS